MATCMMLIEDVPQTVSSEAVAYCRAFLLMRNSSKNQACAFCKAFLIAIYGIM